MFPQFAPPSLTRSFPYAHPLRTRSTRSSGCAVLTRLRLPSSLASACPSPHSAPLQALTRVRRSAPTLWILAPGVGAQGGNLEEALQASLRPDGMGLLLPVSRGISRADDPGQAARDLRDQINDVRRTVLAGAASPGTVLGAAGGASGTTLLPYQKAFIDLALDMGVLKFGQFTLKSGRNSPYFFNAGLFSDGLAILNLCKYYSAAILQAQESVGLDFDVLFGAAYKGIPLVSGIAMVLAEGLVDKSKSANYPFTYNRKEPKDHGEGGVLVGASMQDKKVLVIDDVITAGTAVREAFGIVGADGATPSGVAIAFDRQERTGAEGAMSDLSAIQQVEQEYKVPVVSIIQLKHLLAYVEARPGMENAVSGIREYRTKYGVES